MKKIFYLKCIQYAITILLLNITFANANGKMWPGVDETVVEKIAEESGRPARDPLVNTDRGDLLLFVFLLAGASGGFIAGYSWKELMSCSKTPTAISTVKRGGKQNG